MQSSRAPDEAGDPRPPRTRARVRGLTCERAVRRTSRRIDHGEQSMESGLSAVWLIRHGQSEGNAVRDAATGTEVEALDIADRDMDVELSELGRRQATALGVWIGRLPEPERPDVVYSSPYVRAFDTATALLESAGLTGEIRRDERLRERELGIFDLLTRRGIEARYPAEAERRARLGKFYHRPPGGESWVDVALRARSFFASIELQHPGQRIAIVTHEVVIAIARYLIEELDEAQTLTVTRENPLANCSLTAFEAESDGRLVLDRWNWVVPLQAESAPITEEPDARVAPR